MKRRSGLLVHSAAELVTLAGPHRARRRAEMEELGIIRDGAVACVGVEIVAVGETRDLRQRIATDPALAGVEWNELDASGRCVTPGLIDPHTHLPFAGSREGELGLRQGGAGYLEILASGGGILSTVAATRRASEEELVGAAAPWLDAMVRQGVTTIEAKSGYGLDRESELRQLRAIHRLDAEGPIEIVPTVLAAHAVPAEYAGRADAYLDEVAAPLAAEAAAEGLARFVDVFCERGVFDAQQSERVLTAGIAAGLRTRLHADELHASGGAQLAARIGAGSADHLAAVDEDGIRALAATDGATVATLLPITTLYLSHTDAPARALIEAGVPVAIGTDFNPGTSPSASLQLALCLARIRLRMTAAEAITAATINAAAALDESARLGSVEAGKQADLVVWDVPSDSLLTYWLGVPLARDVVKRGRVAWSARRS